MGEKKIPNAALVRIGQGVCEELGQAPIRSQNAKALTETMTQFVAIERTMTSTVDQVQKAGRNLDALKTEVGKLESAPDAAATLSTRLDQCLELVDLPPACETESAAESQSSPRGTEQ